MSDIPDWLVELAAQQNQEDEEEEEPEWDFLRAEPEPEELPPTIEEAPVPGGRAATTDVPPPMVPAEVDEGDLMDSLRSQVEAVDDDEMFEDAQPTRSIALRIPGLLPWQQFVLAVLLFLDIGVIGFIFLVMLGRISFP